MRSEQEIEDQRSGCVVELEGRLHPYGGVDGYHAAVLQGWIYALHWVLEDDDRYDRSDEIREELGVDDR